MDRFEDHRGVIQDLFDGQEVAVTNITTLKGAVRGNHLHRETIQWTYVVRGELRMCTGTAMRLVGAGEWVYHPPGEAHAWKALRDAECLVFTKGPRSGENYESDTYRLADPLI